MLSSIVTSDVVGPFCAPSGSVVEFDSFVVELDGVVVCIVVACVVVDLTAKASVFIL